MQPIHIVVAHPHPVIVQGLSSALDERREFKIVARCADVASCVEAIRTFRPHITIVGIAMPDIAWLEIPALANAGNALTRVVFFGTAMEEHNLEELADAGAYAVIPQEVDFELLAQILLQVADGDEVRSIGQAAPEHPGASPDRAALTLTDRERQITRLVSEGLSNKEIGRRLNLSDGTIKVHLHHIFQKLEVSNRTALAAFAMSREGHSDPSLDD